MAEVDMRIMLSAVGGAGVTSIIGDVARSLGKGGLVGSLAAVGIGAAAAAVAIGVTAVKAAGDFQAGMTRLVTSAGELPQNLKAVSAGILQMSIDTATSTQQLSAGMYYAESAGYRLATGGLDVIRVAAMGAKSENADLDTVAKALTTTMVDYHMKSSQAADAMNGLIATVQNGKTNLQELAASMGNVLPIASALHVSFPQVAGALDTMTNAGMSAQQASQNLAHVLVALNAPSKVAAKSMASVGLSAQQVKDTLTKQGLPEAFQLIENHVGKYFPAGSVAGEQALKNILGGLVGLKTAAMLTGGSLAETKSNIEHVAGAMRNGHGAVMGWSDVQGTFNFKMDQAKQSLNVLMITIGTALLPVIGNIVTGVTNVISSFADWLNKSNAIQNVISGVGTAMQNTGTFIQNAITTVQNIASAIGAWWTQADLIHKAMDTVHDAVGHVKDIVNDTIGVVQNVVGWFVKWHDPILAVASAITLFFLPAIIKTGVQAVIAGAKLASAFVATMVKTGTEATINGAKTTVQFVASLIKTGTESVINGAKLTASFIASVVKAGVQAVIAGAKMTAQFVASIVKAGIEGWQAAGKLAIMVAQFIASGVQAALAGAAMAGKFIVSIIQSGISAVVTGAQFIASLIPAIISFITESLIAAATAIPGILVGFAAWVVGAAAVAIANIAAFWPIYLVVLAIGVVIAVVILIITHWGQIIGWLGQQWQRFVGFIQLNIKIIGILFSALGAATHAIFSAIGASVGAFFSGLGTWAHNAWASVQSAFGSVGAWFKNLWTQVQKDFSSILGQLGQVASGIWSGITGGFKAGMNDLIKGLNWVIAQLDKIHVSIPGIGSVGFSIPQIPYLAAGGVITSGGLAVVGERGPELLALPTGAGVAPLGSAGGIGPSIYYFFTVNLATMARNQSEVRALVDLIEQELGRRVRGQTPGYSAGGIF